MIDLKKIDIKFVFSAVFGIIALILSVFAGIFSGNGLSTIIFRTFTNTILFSVIGFFCLLVFKKFVPEVYQIIESLNNPEVEVNVNSSAKENEPGKAQDENKEYEDKGAQASISDNVSLETSRNDKELESTFNTLEKDSYRNSSSDMDDNYTANKSGSKDMKIKYEPKIAAQAIRTMLKKDE
jgi:hypothetical protein